MRHIFTKAAALSWCCLVASTCLAADRELSVGLGAGLTPQFEGSKAYRFFPLGSFRYADERISVTTSGPGLEVDLVPSRKLDIGPVVRAGFGRKGGIDDAVVKLLPRVGTAIEVGGFIASGIPLKVLGADDPSILTLKLEAVQDIASGHKGALVSSSVGLVRPLGARTTLIANAGLTYASRRYMQAFFGVTAADALRTRLPTYQPGGGIKDITLTAVTNIKLGDPDSSRWALTVIASAKRLVGPAADSPIVTLRGTPNQGFLGVVASYAFF